MENLTHSLIGIALGKAGTRDADPALRRGAIWAGVLASNLPDVDFVAPLVLGGGKLTYLLHHRGWTHTLVAAPLVALVAAELGRRIAKADATRAVRKTLFFIALAGALLHVLADAMNNYGVHPFSPFDDRWIYGDLIFIAEPLFWFALLPFAAAGAKAGGRRLAIAGTAALLALLWLGPFTTWPIALTVTAWGALVLAAQRRWPASVAVPLAAMALVIGVFASGKARAIAQLESAVAPSGEEIIDLTVRPSPANPLCWDAVTFGRDADGETVVGRTAALSLAPGLFEAKECRPRLGEGRTAPAAPHSLRDDVGLLWTSEFRASQEDLFALVRERCPVDAAMRFLRMPFWTAPDATGTVVIGDLRYDFQEGLDFAEFPVAPGDACPPFVPAWRVR